MPLSLMRRRRPPGPTGPGDRPLPSSYSSASTAASSSSSSSSSSSGGGRSGRSSVISTPASAFESGHVAFARSATSRSSSSGMPSDSTCAVSLMPVIPIADLERDVRGDGHHLGVPASADEAVRELHREARCVRCGEELLGARLLLGLVVPGGPGDVELGDETARRRDDLPLAFHQVADPLHLGSAFGCHLRHHLHSTVRGGQRPLALQHLTQCANRDLELVERRLARRQSLQPQPRREQDHQHAVAWSACRRSGSARTRSRRSPAAARCATRSASTTAGRPKSANTKTPITITQSRNAVPQRGWISEYRCTISGVSSSPAS